MKIIYVVTASGEYHHTREKIRTDRLYSGFEDQEKAEELANNLNLKIDKGIQERFNTAKANMEKVVNDGGSVTEIGEAYSELNDCRQSLLYKTKKWEVATIAIYENLGEALL